jgi:hypothetical protein
MRYVIIIISVLLISCNSQTQSVDATKATPTDLDTSIENLMKSSQTNSASALTVSGEADKAVTKKVEKTVKTITTLKQEVQTLKQENNELKSKIDSAAADLGKPFSLLPAISGGKDPR